MTSFPRVMVTGHRPKLMSSQQQRHSTVELVRVARKLRTLHDLETGISGMALGADTYWACAILDVGAELWSFVPFPQQADRWSEAQRAEWLRLRERASRDVIVAESYSVQARNDAMLDAADLVVAVWDPRRTTGGTASSVRKAEARALPMIHVNLETFVTTSRRVADGAGA